MLIIDVNNCLSMIHYHETFVSVQRRNKKFFYKVDTAYILHVVHAACFCFFYFRSFLRKKSLNQRIDICTLHSTWHCKKRNASKDGRLSLNSISSSPSKSTFISYSPINITIFRFVRINVRLFSIVSLFRISCRIIPSLQTTQRTKVLGVRSRDRIPLGV